MHQFTSVATENDFSPHRNYRKPPAIAWLTNKLAFHSKIADSQEMADTTLNSSAMVKPETHNSKYITDSA